MDAQRLVLILDYNSKNNEFLLLYSVNKLSLFEFNSFEVTTSTYFYLGIA